MIVTGGASGIGEAVVRAFADNGATVGIINRSADSIERALKVADRGRIPANVIEAYEKAGR
jgi:NAD(P)-dependent dehydrogenase (short-subunit alcohol dehydrogenase family)